MTKPDTMLWLSDARGIYIPRDFATSFKDRSASVANVTDEEWRVLEAGPDHEDYWEVWSDVEQNTVVTDEHGVKYRLYQNGDLWLIPDCMIWSDEQEWFVHEDEA